MNNKTTVTVSKETAEDISFVAKRLKMTKKELFATIFKPLCEMCYTVKPFDGSDRIKLIIGESVTAQTLTFFFLGKSRVLCGVVEVPHNASPEETDAAIKAKIEQIEGEND